MNSVSKTEEAEIQSASQASSQPHGLLSQLDFCSWPRLLMTQSHLPLSMPYLFRLQTWTSSGTSIDQMQQIIFRVKGPQCCLQRVRLFCPELSFHSTPNDPLLFQRLSTGEAQIFSVPLDVSLGYSIQWPSLVSVQPQMIVCLFLVLNLKASESLVPSVPTKF